MHILREQKFPLSGNFLCSRKFERCGEKQTKIAFLLCLSVGRVTSGYKKVTDSNRYIIKISIINLLQKNGERYERRVDYLLFPQRQH